MINALANLALATADDRNAVANLTSANSTLAAQIKALNEHNTKQKEEMESLKTNAKYILTLLQDTSLRRNNNNNNRNRNNRQYRPRNTPQIFYCWSHGVTNGEHHTSSNCSNKKQGHQDNATILNRMGGSTRGLE